MEVWRLETDEGIGIYQSVIGFDGRRQPSLWSRSTNNSCDPDWHPIPHSSQHLMSQFDDKAHLRNFIEYSFGFSGKRQFLQWVFDPKWRHALVKNGVLLNIYNVDKRLCLVDNHQVMFIKDKAKLIKTMAVNAFDLEKRNEVR